MNPIKSGLTALGLTALRLKALGLKALGLKALGLKALGLKALGLKALGLAALAGALVPSDARAIPILQLYIEGATYDSGEDTWMFEGDPLRLWVIGNVDGPGGKGTIEDVRLSFVYDDVGSAVTFTLTPSTTGGYNGIADPSVASTAVHTKTVDDGSAPIKSDGNALGPHGVYGAGKEWQEFLLGDFTLTDSPVGDFIDDFPTTLFASKGQINVYALSVIGAISTFHIDAYDHVVAGMHAKAVFAPFSHDAEGTQIVIPEPATLPILVLVFAGVWAVLRRRERREAQGGSFTEP